MQAPHVHQRGEREGLHADFGSDTARIERFKTFAEFKGLAKPFDRRDLYRPLGCGWAWPHQNPD